MFNVQISTYNNCTNRAFDEVNDVIQKNQNEIVHNDNTNIEERSSGIRTIYLGTKNDTNSKYTRNDLYSHANNALLMNEE